MQVIIPMSGFGERFRRAGYTVPKPLIEVDGKPIIAHVIDMFYEKNPEVAHDFLFICNQEHLDNPAFQMAKIVRNYCPQARITGIAPHKSGPVYAVLQAKEMIDPSRPAIVNYCDFSCYWDWPDFQTFVADTGCAGAIPAYKGFHPHTLGTTNYAYIREEKGWVLGIQEKQPFTDNRMEEYASSGTYYFVSGALMLEVFEKNIASGNSVNGEYYVSLAYQSLLAEHKPVAVYTLQHFMQWGTPEDVEEYNGWSEMFRRLMDNRKSEVPSGALVMPMAGLGKRFSDAGYPVPKPLIEISGQPMVVQAAQSFPPSVMQSFVLRSDMPGYAEMVQTLWQYFPNATIECVTRVTEGQAITALLGLEALEKSAMENKQKLAEPVIFAACDSAVLYDVEKYSALCAAPEADVIVWAVRKHANALRHPHMFGWIDAGENGLIKKISVKAPLASPATDPIVIGAFTFRNADDFKRAVQHLVERDGRVNGEFYIDSCINDAIALGLRCYVFEVDSYLSWGTPDDLRTFEYWQSCFHKWAGHPYRLEKDRTLSPPAIRKLEARYAQFPE